MSLSPSARQLSLFGVEATEPSPVDLAGLLAGPGQVVRMGGTARVSVVVDAAWRVHVLVAELAARGLPASWVPTADSHLGVRTSYARDLAPLAAAWLRGAVKRPPADFHLDGPRLRLWVAAAGTSTPTGFLLRLGPSDDQCWAAVGAALAAIGLPAVLVGPRAGRAAGGAPAAAECEPAECEPAGCEPRDGAAVRPGTVESTARPPAAGSAIDAVAEETGAEHAGSEGRDVDRTGVAMVFTDRSDSDGSGRSVPFAPVAAGTAEAGSVAGSSTGPTASVVEHIDLIAESNGDFAEGGAVEEVRWGVRRTTLIAGPAYRITGRRRLARLAELVGERPLAAPREAWPS